MPTFGSLVDCGKFEIEVKGEIKLGNDVDERFKKSLDSFVIFNDFTIM